VDDEVIFILWTNVPDHLLPLAFGSKACAAGDVPKVPEAWELSASVWLISLSILRELPFLLFQKSLTSRQSLLILEGSPLPNSMQG
jgi:hypothetical protein